MSQLDVERAVEGATYVVHLASPVPYVEPDKAGQEAVIRTAREGALTVLRAASKFGIKRVVMTSSIAAVRDVWPKDRLPPGTPYTEENWADPTFQRTQAVYKVSKTLAEKAAWEYQKSLDKTKQFEFVTLCPSLLIGRLPGSRSNTSHDMLNDFFLSKVPPVNSKFSWVAIQDVAEAHLRAVKVPEAANHRFILNGMTSFVPEFLGKVNEHFGPLGYTIPLKSPPYFAIYIGSFFITNVARLLTILNNDY